MGEGTELRDGMATDRGGKGGTVMESPLNGTGQDCPRLHLVDAPGPKGGARQVDGSEKIT